MRLSDAARRRLSDELGENYIVLDIRKAPASTDVLLTHPISPQLLGILRMQFPEARVVITEIEDDELGVHYAGPVSRMLDAGAGAYLPPRPIAELAASTASANPSGGTCSAGWSVKSSMRTTEVIAATVTVCSAVQQELQQPQPRRVAQRAEEAGHHLMGLRPAAASRPAARVADQRAGPGRAG